MWDIKWKATKEQTRKKTLVDTDNSMAITRGKGCGEQQRAKGLKYMAIEKDLTWGGGHTMQYTDHVS